ARRIAIRSFGGGVSGDCYQASAGADLAEDLTLRGHGADAVGNHAGMGRVPIPSHQHGRRRTHWRNSRLLDFEGLDPGLSSRADRPAGRLRRMGYSHVAWAARVHMAWA